MSDNRKTKERSSIMNKRDRANEKEMLERNYGNFYLNGVIRSWSSKKKNRRDLVMEINTQLFPLCSETKHSQAEDNQWEKEHVTAIDQISRGGSLHKQGLQHSSLRVNMSLVRRSAFHHDLELLIFSRVWEET